MRVWDAASGREILALGGHEVGFSLARSVRFTPDGSHIVTASTDMKARVWDVHFATMATDGLIPEACARRLRGLSVLTRDEMRLVGEPDDEPPIDVCAGVGKAPGEGRSSDAGASPSGAFLESRSFRAGAYHDRYAADARDAPRQG
jgi:hypothetical protein